MFKFSYQNVYFEEIFHLPSNQAQAYGMIQRTQYKKIAICPIRLSSLCFECRLQNRLRNPKIPQALKNFLENLIPSHPVGLF